MRPATRRAARAVEGDRALVTDCGGGIGRGIARAVRGEGTVVLGSDIVAPPAEDGIDFLAAHLGTNNGRRTLLDGALARLGTISLLVHAASPRRREVDTPLSVSEETWDAMAGINLRAGFFLAREVGRHMVERGTRGRILLITSQHRELAQPAALQRLEGRHDHGDEGTGPRAGAQGIRVNAIAPGAIPGGGFVADDLGTLVAQIPLGRAGTPRTTSPKWLSRFYQKDLVVMSSERPSKSMAASA